MIPPRIKHRAGVGSLAALAAFAIVVAVGIVTPTTAAWTDQARFSATADTGTWVPVSTLGSCAIVTADSQPVAGESCSLTSVVLIEQGGQSPGALLRQYDVTFATSAPNSDYLIRFSVDFASPDATTVLTPNPAWTWNAASTSPGGDYTPAPGYLCTSLPSLEASAPFEDQMVRVTVRDHLTADRTCS